MTVEEDQKLEARVKEYFEKLEFPLYEHSRIRKYPIIDDQFNSKYKVDFWDDISNMYYEYGSHRDIYNSKFYEWLRGKKFTLNMIIITFGESKVYPYKTGKWTQVIIKPITNEQK